MGNIAVIVAIGFLTLCFVGGLGFVFVSAGTDASKKRLATVVRPTASRRVVKGAQDNNQQRRKNVQSMLKELGQKQAESRKRISIGGASKLAGSKSRETFGSVLVADSVMAGHPRGSVLPARRLGGRYQRCDPKTLEL